MGEFCTDVLDDIVIGDFIFGGGQLGLIVLLIALMYISMSVVIMSWIKKQEQNAKAMVNDLDTFEAKNVIFPVFVNVMWINSYVNLLIGVILLLVAGAFMGVL